MTKDELRNLLLDFADHLNSYKGFEEARFDFMVVDYLDKIKQDGINTVLCEPVSGMSEEATVGKEREAQSQSAGNSESTAPDIGDFVPMIWLIEKLRWPPEKRVTMNELIANVRNEFTFTIKRKSSEEAL